MKVGHLPAPSLERGRNFVSVFLTWGGVLVKAVLGCLGAILRHLVLRHPGAILGHLGAILGFVVLSCSLVGTIEGHLDTA